MTQVIKKKSFTKKLLHFFSLCLYYSCARYLPQYLPGGHECRQVRSIFCQHIFRTCGKNVNIKRNAYFGSGKNIDIGSNSDIGLNAYITGIDAGGELVIGNNVIMGPDVMILTLNHKYDDINKPIREQGRIPSKIIINDDVWIGARVTILPGVQIGKGSVIGACSVVTKDVSSYDVVGGNPARVIKKRGTIK